MFLFSINGGGAAGFTLYVLVPDSSQPLGQRQVFLNLSLLATDVNGPILAHEIGHIFQLPHTGRLTTGLMCGPAPTDFATFDNILNFVGLGCGTTPNLILDDVQIRSAQIGATKWQ